MRKSTEIIVRNGVVAALYFVLTLLTFPVSFLGIQFRIAEVLVLLCFFRKDYVIGITFGCVIANLFSTIGVIDAVFGLVTNLAVGLLVGRRRYLAIACLFPVVINAFLVGAELYWILKEPFWYSVGTVAIGELGVMVLGYFIFFFCRRNDAFMRSIKGNQNLDYKF